MISGIRTFGRALFLAGFASFCGTCVAAERVILRNGFEFVCTRQEPAGDRIRLYLASDNVSGSVQENFVEVDPGAIVRTEPVEPGPAPLPAVPLPPLAHDPAAEPTAAEMRQMLAAAGERHNLDADLLASIVRAESGGHIRAVSRAGAQGLMQLMPSTAAEQGVADAFVAEQNIGGGTAYLDQLLTRYHENLASALAAYNAGSAAVDRYRGIPPYPETRAYVARVIREFNRRKRLDASPSGRAALTAR